MQGPISPDAEVVAISTLLLTSPRYHLRIRGSTAHPLDREGYSDAAECTRTWPSARTRVSRLLARLFDFLSAADPPVPSDAIFVLAGRPERKRYGLDLFKRGLAPVLILSVGRFEWRRFPELGLPDDGGLTRLVEETYYRRRHFFVTVRAEGACARFVPTQFLGTRREAL